MTADRCEAPGCPKHPTSPGRCEEHEHLTHADGANRAVMLAETMLWLSYSLGRVEP